MALIGQVVTEKIKFYISFVNDLWPRSRNDLDLLYSQHFTSLICCLYLSTFRSQATKLPEKFSVFTFFSIEKPM